MAMEVKGLGELKVNLNKFKGEAIATLAKAVGEGTVIIRDIAKLNHPYTDRTENLTNSIKELPVKIRMGKITGETEAGMEYAAAVELGTARSRPFPYLMPALELSSQLIAMNIISLLRKIKWVELWM